MKISLVQFDIIWEDIPANLEKVESLIQSIGPTDIIVLPEMFTTGFTMHAIDMAETMEGRAVSAMKRWSKEHDALLMGSVIIKEADRYYNRMLSVHPDGKIQTYDKRHLFTFAGEDKHYAPGSAKVDLVHFKGWKILPQICYDVRFPVFSRFSEEKNYDAMIYVANFPNKRIDAWSHLLRARAIENQAYVIGVNRSGLDGLGNYYNGESQCIDYSGQIIVSLTPGEWIKTEELDLDALKKFRQNFPFLVDRDIQ